jgi:hypothetical protein
VLLLAVVTVTLEQIRVAYLLALNFSYEKNGEQVPQQGQRDGFDLQVQYALKEQTAYHRWAEP